MHESTNDELPLRASKRPTPIPHHNALVNRRFAKANKRTKREKKSAQLEADCVLLACAGAARASAPQRQCANRSARHPPEHALAVSKSAQTNGKRGELPVE